MTTATNFNFVFEPEFYSVSYDSIYEVKIVKVELSEADVDNIKRCQEFYAEMNKGGYNVINIKISFKGSFDVEFERDENDYVDFTLQLDCEIKVYDDEFCFVLSSCHDSDFYFESPFFNL